MPQLNGAALIVGNNPVADSVENRCRMAGVAVYRIAAELTLSDLDTELDRIWANDSTPHLFLTTPHDDAACWTTLDTAGWERRHSDALAIPYRVCQRWMQRTIDDDRMGKASLVTTLKLGGGFGFDAMSESVQTSEQIKGRSAESGGLAGLTKAMLIEAWMRGYRDTPMLVVDQIEGASLMIWWTVSSENWRFRLMTKKSPWRVNNAWPRKPVIVRLVSPPWRTKSLGAEPGLLPAAVVGSLR